MILSVLFAVILAVAILLWLNRGELLKVINNKETIIDANTRAITDLEGQNNYLLVTLEDHKKQLEEITGKFDKEKIRNDVVISQKKSSETKLGQISEQIAPFLEGYNHDPKETRFLGSPIDLIAFNFAKPAITFIEIKTGDAKESKRQKIIKEAIRQGKVYYEQMRINNNGVNVKRGKNDN